MSQCPDIAVLNDSPCSVKRVLFLGYGASQTTLIDALIARHCTVHHTDAPIDSVQQYDLAVSFGYRHIIGKAVIDALGCPIMNLHIAYLPFNRGAHPNFWSFYDNTPSGVTIHLVDEGIDTGAVVYQQYVKFDEDEITFAQTQQRLVKEIEWLFVSNIDSILSGSWVAKIQNGRGTYHCVDDLPADFAGWNSPVEQEIMRLSGTLE